MQAATQHSTRVVGCCSRPAAAAACPLAAAGPRRAGCMAADAPQPSAGRQPRLAVRARDASKPAAAPSPPAPPPPPPRQPVRPRQQVQALMRKNVLCPPPHPTPPPHPHHPCPPTGPQLARHQGAVAAALVPAGQLCGRHADAGAAHSGRQLYVCGRPVCLPGLCGQHGADGHGAGLGEPRHAGMPGSAGGGSSCGGSSRKLWARRAVAVARLSLWQHHRSGRQARPLPAVPRTHRHWP